LASVQCARRKIIESEPGLDTVVVVEPFIVTAIVSGDEMCAVELYNFRHRLVEGYRCL